MSSKVKNSTPPSSAPLSSTAPDTLQPVDENFLQQLRAGAHLFSADYTMYSVVDVPTENDIVLTQSFDEKEEKKSYTWDDLLAGQWWYNPEAPHKNQGEK